MAEKDLERLRGAYAAAWRVRQLTGDASPAILIEHLTARARGAPSTTSGLEGFTTPGPGRDLVMSLWGRGVPPEAFDRELRGAAPGFAWAGVKSIAAAAFQLARVFRGGEWADFSWMDLPQGHRKLSDARRTNDLAMRWLHEPVDKVALDLCVDEAADAVIERCRQTPSPNRTGWAEARCCWLLPGASPNVQVMVGGERIGWTTVPAPAWGLLKREEERRIYADGSVLLHDDGPEIELACFLPRNR